MKVYLMRSRIFPRLEFYTYCVVIANSDEEAKELGEKQVISWGYSVGVRGMQIIDSFDTDTPECIWGFEHYENQR